MTASGAYKHDDDDLYCRTCGRLCDIEDGRLSCNNGCFDEPFQMEEAEE